MLGVIQLISDFLGADLVNKHRRIGNAPKVIVAMSFFDGVVARGRGGAGMVLYISKTRSFYLKIGCGNSTNTRA